jgi:hypothetical protein
MSEEQVNTIINNAIALANSQTILATDAANDLLNSNAGFYLTPPSGSAGFNVEAIEPIIPTVNDSTLTYEAQLDKLIALLSNQLAGFFATYYPLASDAFDEATNWLVNTITNGGTGINVAVEDATWQRDRERIISDGRRVQATISTGFASKGYTLVPGAMQEDIKRALFEQAANTGIASTSKAAKHLEIEIETIKFAIGKAIDSRTMAMNAAADYIRAIASSPDAAARVAGLNTENQARMVAAYSSWYSTRLDRDKIVLGSKLAEMNSRDDIYKHRRDVATRNSQVDLQALIAAAEVYGGTAKASLASLNSVAATSVNAFS